MFPWLHRLLHIKPGPFSIQVVDGAYTLVEILESATLQRPGVFRLGKELDKSLKRGERKFLIDLRSFPHLWLANDETMGQVAYLVEEYGGTVVFVVGEECLWHTTPSGALHIVSSIEAGARILMGA